MNLEIVIENSTAEISSCIQTREANEEEKEEISKDLEALLNTREGFKCLRCIHIYRIRKLFLNFKQDL